VKDEGNSVAESGILTAGDDSSDDRYGTKLPTALAFLIVRNVIEYRSADTGGIMCCQRKRAVPEII
jgi:hypothetical protein